MRRILAISLILFSSLITQATIWHISPDGNDSFGDGTEGNPWRGFEKATTSVTIFGDTIYVHEGSYPITSGCSSPVGITVIGDGEGSYIYAAASMTTMYTLYSATNTDGNQVIRDVYFYGDSLATFGIRITARNNVDLINVKVDKMIRYGVTYADQASRSVMVAPTQYITGCVMTGFTIVDCGRDVYTSSWEADAALDISGTEGMEISNFYIDNQTGGRYAYGIKGLYGGGFHKGLKIHDGTIRTNIRDIVGQQSFGFNIELWTGVGGVEIYNINGNGAIDLGGYGWWDAYSYGYAAWVHDCQLKQAARPTNQGEAGLILESGSEDGVIFERITVDNFSTGFTLGTTAASLIQGFDSVVISTNLFINIGFSSGGLGAGITGYNLSTGVTITRLHVLNNVIHKVNNSSGHGISFEYTTANSWSATHLKNNIIFNAYTPIQFRYQTIDDIHITNDLTYGATRTITNSTSWEFSTWNTREVADNQEGVDPLFINTGIDFRLQSSSTCIDAGTNVGLTTDFLLNPAPSGSSFDIGAYEYQHGAGAVIPHFGKTGNKFGKTIRGTLSKY